MESLNKEVRSKTDEHESVLEGKMVQNVSTVRRYSPQFIASFARNLLYISLGFSDAFTAIVIPSLTGISSELNPDETLHITAAQASWLGELI